MNTRFNDIPRVDTSGDGGREAEAVTCFISFFFQS
jgi:hypothetical protein